MVLKSEYSCGKNTEGLNIEAKILRSKLDGTRMICDENGHRHDGMKLQKDLL